MSGLRELQRLHWARPAADATAVEVAAWYQRKAAVLDEIGRPDDAAIARAHALELIEVTTR